MSPQDGAMSTKGVSQGVQDANAPGAVPPLGVGRDRGVWRSVGVSVGAAALTVLLGAALGRLDVPHDRATDTVGGCATDTECVEAELAARAAVARARECSERTRTRHEFIDCMERN